MLDETIDTVCEYTLDVALTRPTSCVGRHHSGHRGVGSQKRTKFRCGLKLGREYRLDTVVSIVREQKRGACLKHS